jgi:hypothetical protein
MYYSTKSTSRYNIGTVRDCSVLFTLMVFLGACGSGTAPEAKPEAKKEAAPVVPVGGLHALYQMYTASKSWAPDAQIYQLTSIPVADVKPEPGKVGAWQAILVSPSLQQSITCTFSVADESVSLPKGVEKGKPESWSPHGYTVPFSISDAKTDSVEAYAVAATKAADYMAKHPDMNITYQLEQQNGKYRGTAWHILWGETPGSSSFSIVVDATTGAYVETLH